MACVCHVLDVLLALVRNKIRDPDRLEDCPLHLVSTALFVLTLPFRGDSEQKQLNLL